jgi:hypothetical protein
MFGGASTKIKANLQSTPKQQIKKTTHEMSLTAEWFSFSDAI